jgi:hypothetical protein
MMDSCGRLFVSDLGSKRIRSSISIREWRFFAGLSSLVVIREIRQPPKKRSPPFRQSFPRRQATLTGWSDGLAADFADFAEKPETAKAPTYAAWRPPHDKKSSRAAQTLFVCSADKPEES